MVRRKVGLRNEAMAAQKLLWLGLDCEVNPSVTVLVFKILQLLLLHCVGEGQKVDRWQEDMRKRSMESDPNGTASTVADSISCRIVMPGVANDARLHEQLVHHRLESWSFTMIAIAGNQSPEKRETETHRAPGAMEGAAHERPLMWP
jgi:hypothetical protein